jgi:hypothetical protein
MSSIRITINGKHKYTVSLEGHPGMLNCAVGHTHGHPEPHQKDEYYMSFGGIDKATGDYLEWEPLDLAVGDRIELEILESSDSFPIASREPRGENADVDFEKDEIRSMAKKFGWEIIEREVPSDTNQREQAGESDDDKPLG